MVGPRRSRRFKIEAFNAGNYAAAVAEQIDAKNLSRVLYPDDSTPQGKELRFKQQYFCVSASLQDMLAQHLAERRQLKDLAQAIAIQLNDTHPALTVVELMRLLVDVYDLQWAGRVADHAARSAATPITRCCPRRWRPGRSRSSSGSCRATCRSSTRSIATSSKIVSATLSATTWIAAAACR